MSRGEGRAVCGRALTAGEKDARLATTRLRTRVGSRAQQRAHGRAQTRAGECQGAILARGGLRQNRGSKPPT